MWPIARVLIFDRMQSWASISWCCVDLVTKATLSAFGAAIQKVFPVSKICTILNAVFRRLIPPDLSEWTYTPPPEEDEVGKAENNDLDIILVSDSFFLDDQISRTLTECTQGMSTLYIMKCYNEIGEHPRLNAFEPRGEDAIGPKIKIEDLAKLDSKLPSKSKFRVEVGKEARERLEGIVRNELVHRSMNPEQDASWFDVIGFILKNRESEEWWYDLPTFITQLTRSSLEYGAGPVFLAIYCHLLDENDKGLSDLYAIFKQNPARGDVQCKYLFEFLNTDGSGLCITKDLGNLINIIKIIYEVVWRTSGATHSYGWFSDFIPWSQGKLDNISVLRTFSWLHVLVPPEVHDAQRKDISDVIAKVWDKYDPVMHPRLLPSCEDITSIICLGIEGGSLVPFLKLYSSSTQESFKHLQMYSNHDTPWESMQCMHFHSSSNRYS